MSTYPQARDAFLSEMVRSPHTVRNYRRGIELFITFAAPSTPLAHLGARDRAILVRYTQWLLDERALSPPTAKLYATACRRWFEWMGLNDYLPQAFPLAKALHALSDALAANLFRPDRRAPEPPDGIELVIRYYDTVELPERLQARPDPERVRRWQLTTQRNRALLRCLGESGGRISEVLSLRVGDFPPQAFAGSEVWRVTVSGKAGHRYDLRFLDSLPYIEQYLAARGAAATREAASGGPPPHAPLFVAHSKRYEGRPLSRVAAWKVVDEARRALGLPGIHPHDFRHWCASKLINAGQPLDVVQEYLGHRSVETTRAYYAHTKSARVDEAARTVRLLKGD